MACIIIYVVKIIFCSGNALSAGLFSYFSVPTGHNSDRKKRFSFIKL